MGLMPDNPVAAMRERIAAVQDLLAGSTVTVEGERFGLDAVSITHGPTAHVPITLGVMGPKMLQLAGELADVTLFAATAGVGYFRYATSEVGTGLERAGRSPEDMAYSTIALACADRDGAAARDKGRPVLASFLAEFSSMNTFRAYGISDQLPSIVDRGGAAAVEAEMPDQWLEDLALVGTPEEVLKRRAAGSEPASARLRSSFQTSRRARSPDSWPRRSFPRSRSRPLGRRQVASSPVVSDIVYDRVGSDTAFRLLVVNPNSDVAVTGSLRATSIAALPVGSVVTGMTCTDSPLVLESAADSVRAASQVLAVVQARSDSTDAVFVGCFGDPVVAALREVTGGPVVGLGEVALTEACLTASRFGLLTTLRLGVPGLWAQLERAGLAARCGGVRPVFSGESGHEGASLESLVGPAHDPVSDAADGVVLACAVFASLGDELSTRIGAPVFDGVGFGASLAFSLWASGRRRDGARDGGARRDGARGTSSTPRD